MTEHISSRSGPLELPNAFGPRCDACVVGLIGTATDPERRIEQFRSKTRTMLTGQRWDNMKRRCGFQVPPSSCLKLDIYLDNTENRAVILIQRIARSTVIWCKRHSGLLSETRIAIGPFSDAVDWSQSTMPMFYLNFREGDVVTEDSEGWDHANVSAAREAAVKGARDILAEMIRAGEAVHDQQIEICDDSGSTVDIVRIGEIISAKNIPPRTID